MLACYRRGKTRKLSPVKPAQWVEEYPERGPGAAPKR